MIFADPGGFIDLQHIFTANEPLPSLHPSLTREGRLIYGQPSLSQPVGTPDFLQSSSHIRSAELDLYRQALNAHRGNVSAAARSLGISRAKLEYRLRKNGLLDKD
ncbi:MAG: helix-turn-helix domain-containing protein [Allorhizobium sp.]|uniref:helix-turn-helix domain-containing protein n=1 Tax=Allorhizobium sp. TaxID=633478 RepID=UPI004034F044